MTKKHSHEAEESTEESPPKSSEWAGADPVAPVGGGFVSEFPADEIRLLATALMTGTFKANAEIAYACLQIESYGLGQLLGQPNAPAAAMESVGPVVAPKTLASLDATSVPAHSLDNKSAANLLNDALKAHEEGGNEAVMGLPPINWLKIVQFVGPILIKILSGLV